LDTFLSDTLNAEIAVKTIYSTQDAVDYLTWTYLYRRLARNPNYYGLTSVGQLALSEYLSELVESSIAELEQYKCIQHEDDKVSSLNLGLIAAYYGIACATVEMMALTLKETSRMRAILECVSAAVEFDSLSVREGERVLLEKLHMRVPYKTPDAHYEDVHLKAFLLLQAHCMRIQLPGTFDNDRRDILIRVLPIVQAAVDVTSSNGHLKACLAAMECSQMIVQAMMPNDSPMKQLSTQENTLLLGVASVYDLDESILNQIPPMLRDEVIQSANRYPSLEVQLGFDSSEIPHGEEATLRASISRTAAPGPITAPYYPRRKDEAWWLMVGAGEILLAIKRFVVEEVANLSVGVDVEGVGKIPVKVYLICDSYVGADQEFDLFLNIVPG